MLRDIEPVAGEAIVPPLKRSASLVAMPFVASPLLPDHRVLMSIHDGQDRGQRRCPDLGQQSMNVGSDSVQVVIGVHFSEMRGPNITGSKRMEFGEIYP